MHTIQYFPEMFTDRNFLWLMQTLLACVLVYAGASRTVMHRHTPAGGNDRFLFDCEDLPCWLASFIALLEIIGGLFLLIPGSVWSRELLVQGVAGVMALLMAYTAIYHLRRRGPAAPVIAVFFMALFVIVGYAR